MSGDTTSTKYMFIIATHDRVSYDITANDTMQCLADTLFESLVIITNIVGE